MALLFCINVGFSGLRSQSHFSQNVLFISRKIFGKVSNLFPIANDGRSQHQLKNALKNYLLGFLQPFVRNPLDYQFEHFEPLS